MREITGGAGVPVVYDSVGKDTFLASLDCLKPLGLMVSFGNASGKAAAHNIEQNRIIRTALDLSVPVSLYPVKTPGER